MTSYFFPGVKSSTLEAEAWVQRSVSCLRRAGCDAGDGDASSARARFVWRAGFGDPDFFRLRGERCGGEGELEAVEAFFGEGWGLEGFFEQVAELIGDVVGGCGECLRA